MSKKILLIDDKLMNEIVEEFIDQMFGYESNLDRNKFLENLKGENFKWLLSSQSVREKIDQKLANNKWIKYWK